MDGQVNIWPLSLEGLGEEEGRDQDEPIGQTYVLMVSPFWGILSEYSTKVGGPLSAVEACVLQL